MTNTRAFTPDSIYKEIEDLKRRLRDLESSPQLSSSSVKEGSLKILDSSGNVVVTLGKLLNGNYGLQIVNGAGGLTTFLADSDSAALPPMPVPSRIDIPQTITSGTFVNLCTGEVERLAHDAVRVRSSWATDATATGEIRIANASAGTFTNAIAIPANSSGIAEFHWLHGQTLSAGPYYFRVQARRTSGGGVMNVYPADGGFSFQRGSTMTPVATVTGV